MDELLLKHNLLSKLLGARFVRKLLEAEFHSDKMLVFVSVSEKAISNLSKNMKKAKSSFIILSRIVEDALMFQN